MAVDIKLPALGESITEATLSRWLKKDGDFVRAGQPICEVETEKATQEVTAPVDGRLSQKVREGTKLPIGAVIGKVDESAAPVAAEPAKKIEPKAAPAPKPKEEAAPLLSPSARALVEEHGLEPAKIKGTGRDGRIIKEDVLTALEKREPAPPPAPPSAAEPKAPPVPAGERTESRQRMTAIRQRIAERLVAAQREAAILTTFNEADMSAVMALRARYKEPFQKKHGIGLGFMSFFVKASVEALRAFPLVNSWLDGTDIITPSYCDIGVAVSTEKGLMVPVLRNADRLSFAGIEKSIAELAEKARSGKILPADLEGGTFTITNGGIFGSMLSTPILKPPQTGILGMHVIQKRAVVVDDQIVIRPMMYLALSYDHRLIDGREAVSFLVRIKECIESPERLLLEV